MNAPLSVEDARAVLAACRAVARWAESTLREAREELERRTALRDQAQARLCAAEHRFDVEEDSSTASAVASARAELEGAELLVTKARDRLERAESAHRTALDAKERAEHDTRVGELRARLDAPPATLDSIDAARLELAQARVAAELMVGAARERFDVEIGRLFVRLDDDDRVRQELEAIGVHVPPTSPLRFALPWLREQIDAGELHLDTRAAWQVSSAEVLGEGALSAAYGSLVPLGRSLARRSVEGVLEAFERLAVPDPDCEQVARELLELLAEHRDTASLLSAIAEREAPEGERLRVERQEAAQRAHHAQPAQRSDSHRKYLESQARMGNAYAKRQLGLEGQVIIEGRPLPSPGAMIPTLLRAGASALGLLPESEPPAIPEKKEPPVPMLRLASRTEGSAKGSFR